MFSHFLSLTNFTKEEKEEKARKYLHINVKSHFSVKLQDPNLEILAKTTISFSMVRHPFERLVSAYENKVVGKDKHYAWLPEHLKSLYGNTSFLSFVEMVLAQGQEVPSYYLPVIDLYSGLSPASKPALLPG